MNEITERLWKGTQSVNYESVWEWPVNTRVFKIRLRIKRDSYHCQSYARAYVWSDTELKWNLIVDLPGELIQTFENIQYWEEPTSHAPFYNDIKDLLDEARAILDL